MIETSWAIDIIKLCDIDSIILVIASFGVRVQQTKAVDVFRKSIQSLSTDVCKYHSIEIFIYNGITCWLIVKYARCISSHVNKIQNFPF